MSSNLQVAAIHPTDERSFQTACTTQGKWVVICMNLTVRLGFSLRPSFVENALTRGRVFEVRPLSESRSIVLRG